MHKGHFSNIIISIINTQREVIKIEIKDLIKEKRLELGLTYEQLGNLIGVGKSTVRKWETGLIENMRRDNIIALSKALNISPAVLMGWNVEKTHLSNENIDTYSKEEKNHIEDLRKLNDMGKKKVITYTKDLTEMPKYQKQIWEEEGKEYLMPKAAHELEGDFTEEDYKHDEDIMMDDEFWSK
ncbi:helix-turn-helix transcriptional regulator [Clostridium baratii]